MENLVTKNGKFLKTELMQSNQQPVIPYSGQTSSELGEMKTTLDKH